MNLEQYKNAEEIFRKAVQAVQPKVLLHKYIKRFSNTLVLHKTRLAITPQTQVKLIAVGKAAWAMAWEAEAILGSLITAGICITKYKHAGQLRYCEVVEAAHPVPDAKSVAAAEKVKRLLNNTTRNQIVIVLLSGGASSLMVDVPSTVTFSDLQKTFQLLVNSGLSIHEINTVRKHLSELKGGGLAKLAYPATVFSFIISDVVGDNVDVIASGPTVPDGSTFADAYQIIEKAELLTTLPQPIVQYLIHGKTGLLPETPKANHPCFVLTNTAIIGSNRIALQHARKAAVKLGYKPILLRKSIHCSAEEAVDTLLKRLKQENIIQPVCLLAGGETTVAVNTELPVKGGRNLHVALQAVAAHPNFNFPYEVVFFSGATDGTDGTSQTAGAITHLQHPKHHLNVVQHSLKTFRSYYYFKKMGDLFCCQVTQTNVMDLFIVIAVPAK